MGLLSKFNDFLEAFLCRIVGVTLIVFTMLISVQVFLRAVFSYPLSWAQDGAIMLFIWTIFGGAPVALRRRLHFSIDLFNNKFPRAEQLLDAVGDVIIYAFLFVMIVQGKQFLGIAHTMYYSYIYMPQSYIAVAIPISGAAMFFINTENLVRDLQKLKAGDARL